MYFRWIAAALALLTASCGGSGRKFSNQNQAVLHLKGNQQAYERLARDWRAEGQRELCREPGGRFQWNDMAVSRRVLGWKLRRANQSTGELIDLRSLDEVAGVLGTTSARINRFLSQMDALDVACISNVGVTLGDREGSYVQIQLSPFVEMYGFRFAPAEDSVSSQGLKQWSEQPPDAHARRLVAGTPGWYYFEGLVRTAALPLSRAKGTLRDITGVPMPHTRLQLAIAREDGSLDWGAQTVTDQLGRFSFVQIPAGTYVLGLNLFSWTETDAPFPRTFYPGVRLRQEARSVAIGEGRDMDLADFRVPYRVGNRRVSAEVVWPGGKPEPAADADLCWEDVEGKRCAPMSAVNGRPGLYTYDGADGVPYHVNAHYRPRFRPFSRNASAEPVRVPIISLEGPVQLVLK